MFNILYEEITIRCQVELINMQSQADSQNKCLLVYQDHFTKLKNGRRIGVGAARYFYDFWCKEYTSKRQRYITWQ